MKNILKKTLPPFIWNNARDTYYGFSHILCRIGPQTKTRNYCGFRLYYNCGNSIIDRLKFEPVFEKEMCEMIVFDLNKSKTPKMLDIGANIGFISLYVVSEVSAIKIYAFEPGLKQAGYFKKTIEANALSERVVLNTFALSDSNGTQTFYSHPRRDMSKDGLKDTGRGERTVVTEVKTMTLDSWWKGVGMPNIDVVKIDTEGAELLILRCAKEFLAKVKPIIYLEIAPSNLKAYPYKVSDILKYLGEAGYRLVTLSGELVTADNLNELLVVNETFRAISDGQVAK